MYSLKVTHFATVEVLRSLTGNDFQKCFGSERNECRGIGLKMGPYFEM